MSNMILRERRNTMTNQGFENLREEFLSKEAELLEWKGQEYGSNYKTYSSNSFTFTL